MQKSLQKYISSNIIQIMLFILYNQKKKYHQVFNFDKLINFC